ncbi:hypothetical protein ACHWQZ_G001342 [Mnemiopsis leidyi]
MYRRLLSVYRSRNVALSKHKISLDDIVLGIIVILFLVNAILFVSVVTTQEGRALEADHIRNFRNTFPSARGLCSPGYELNTVGSKKQSPSQQIFTLLSNFAFRLLTGRSVHKCRPCSPGSSKKKGDRFCSLCTPGQFQLEKGRSKCLRCPAGSHQPGFGGVSCQTCPAGSYQPREGGTECLPCPELTYQPLNGSRACIPCSLQDQDSQCPSVLDVIDGDKRDSSLVCVVDRCKLEVAQHKQLISDDRQPDFLEEDGGFFIGFLPDFNTLTGLLGSSDEKEVGGSNGLSVRGDEIAEGLIVDSSVSDVIEPPSTVTVDELSPQNNGMNFDIEDAEAKPVEFDNILKNENNFSLEYDYESDKIDAARDAETITEFVAADDSEVNPELDQPSPSDNEDAYKMDLVDKNFVETNGKLEKGTEDNDMHAATEIINSLNELKEEEKPVKGDSDCPVEITDKAFEGHYGIEIINEVSDDAISENEDNREEEQKDVPSTLPEPKNSPPTRSSDHPILQKITKEIQQNNGQFKLYSPRWKDKKETGNDRNDITSLETIDNSPPTFIIEDESPENDEYVKVAEQERKSEAETKVAENSKPSDLNAGRLYKDVKFDIEPASADPTKAENEDQQTMSNLKISEVTENKEEQTVLNLEVPEVAENKEEQTMLDLEVPEVTENAEEDPEDDQVMSKSTKVLGQDFGFSSQGLPDNLEQKISEEVLMKPDRNSALSTSEVEADEDKVDEHGEDSTETADNGCDLRRALGEWVTEGKTSGFEDFWELLVAQFDALRNHSLLVLGSELHLIVIPVTLSIFLSYLSLMGIALHMLIVTERNFLTMSALFSQMVFLASFILLEDEMKVDHVMAAVLVVLSTAYLAATLRVVDQISKSCPNMSMPMKVAMTIILDALATLGVILSINCGMFSGSTTKYRPPQDEVLQNLLSISRLVSIPAVLIRIESEVSRSRINQVQGLHVIDLLMESSKFVLAILSLFSGSLLQLTVVSSVGVTLTAVQELLWEMLSERNSDNEEIEPASQSDDEREYTEIRALIESTSYISQLVMAEEDVFISDVDMSEVEGELRSRDTSHLRQTLAGGVEIDKRELTFDRGRLHTNRDVVVYINKEPIEEMVSFNSESECKLYLAQMTGSCESLESMLLEQVRRDSQKTNSESSNDDYIIIPKIVVECGDQERKQVVDCLCIDLKSKERRRCRSADSCQSHSSADLVRPTAAPCTLLDEKEEEDRRCHSSLSSFGNGSCLTCRKTKL